MSVRAPAVAALIALCLAMMPSLAASPQTAGDQPALRRPPAFGPGRWAVNRHMPAGRYYSQPRAGCYWERQRAGAVSPDHIIANEYIGFDAAQWIVDIFSTDAAFYTHAQCGAWLSSARIAAQSTIRSGVWLVGAQLAPGTYRTSAAEGCYWARLRNFTSELHGMIDNEFAAAPSELFVTLTATDVGFETDADCGVWTRAAEGSAPPRDAVATADEILLRWMLNQEQESMRAPAARRRAAEDSPR